MTWKSPWLVVALAATVFTVSPNGQRADAGAIDVIHYDARIEPDIAGRSIRGVVTIRFAARRAPQIALAFDSGDLTVDAVREGGAPRNFSQREHRVYIQLGRAADLDEEREIDVEYHGLPRSGLLFFPDRSQVYTVFSTSQWLVCIDAPDDKATLRLVVTLPGGLTAVGSGRLIDHRAVPDGRTRYEWRQEKPVPTYTFGFAAGTFSEATESRRDIRVRYLAEGFAPAELRPGRLLFFEGISVIVLLLRDLTPRVPEILPCLLVLEESPPVFE